MYVLDTISTTASSALESWLDGFEDRGSGRLDGVSEMHDLES